MSYLSAIQSKSNLDYMLKNQDSVIEKITEYLSSVPIQVIFILLFALVLNAIVRIAISRFVKGAIKRANDKAPQFKKVADNTAELSAMVMQQRTVQRVKAIGQLFSSTATIVIWTVAIMSALSVLGINVAPLLASAGVAGVALGFGAQTLIKDFLAGIFIILEDQYGVGDVVDLGPAIGTVEEVDLRVTRLRDMSGVVWYVRNGEILRVANRSQGWTVAVVDVPIAYDEDLEKIRVIIERVGKEMVDDPAFSGMLLDAPQYAGVEQVSGDAVFVRITAKTAPDKPMQSAREIREKLKVAFDREHVRVPVLARPFPTSPNPNNPSQR
jgi:small-conductance mechanosensitive channel